MVYRPDDAGSVNSLVKGVMASPSRLWKNFLLCHEIRSTGMIKEGTVPVLIPLLLLTMMTYTCSIYRMGETTSAGLKLL